MTGQPQQRAKPPSADAGTAEAGAAPPGNAKARSAGSGADAAPDLDVLEDLLSFYVRSANYLLSRDLDRRLTGLEVARGTGKITTLLLIDSHPGVRPSAIARATLRDRPTLSRTVAPMIEAGLIEQRRSETEGRAVALYITPRGHAVAETVRGIVKAQSEAFFAPLSPADRGHLLRILRKLYLIARDGGIDRRSAP